MKNEFKKNLVNVGVEINNIKEIITRKKPFDKERNYLTMYALMYACGTIELTFKKIIASYFDKSRISQVRNYIEKIIIDAATSPLYDNIVGTLNKIDNDWGKKFKEIMAADRNMQRLIVSLRSLVESRHAFAHGKSTSITISSICEYYSDAVVVLGYVDSVIK